MLVPSWIAQPHPKFPSLFYTSLCSSMSLCVKAKDNKRTSPCVGKEEGGIKV